MATPVFGRNLKNIQFYDTSNPSYQIRTTDEIKSFFASMQEAIAGVFTYNAPSVPQPSMPNNMSGLFNATPGVYVNTTDMSHQNITGFLQPSDSANRVFYNADDATDIQTLLHQRMLEWGWGEDQWGPLYELIKHESNFNPGVYNYEGSGAFGLFQFMPSTWELFGFAPTDNVETQIELGFTYIERVYGDPAAAWVFWQRTDPRTTPDNPHGRLHDKNWY